MEELVSVLMSVHNEKYEYLETAINSICNQTYQNIEFIIIDDASDKNCSSYLKELCKNHSMIKLFRNEMNLGLTKTLNIGISHARGAYIARMDADDYSCPQRIERQVELMRQYPDIDILGTGVVSFGKQQVFMSPTNGFSNKEIQAELFFTSTLCHPSVMIRCSFLERTGIKYDEDVKKGQDYDLWERASIVGHLAVTSEVLLYYRLHDTQITSTNTKDQNFTATAVMKRRLSRIGIYPTDNEFHCHLALKGIGKEIIPLSDVEAWAKKILYFNTQHTIADATVFNKNIHKRLVLYKIKSKQIPKISDICVIIKLIVGRIQMQIKLRRNIKNISILNLQK